MSKPFTDKELEKVVQLVNQQEMKDPELRQLIKDWDVTVADGIDDYVP